MADVRIGSYKGVVVITAATAVGIAFIRKWLRLRSMPPVYRTGLPVVGPLLAFLKSPNNLYTEAQKQCGEVFTLDLLATQLVCLCGEDAHELFFTADKYLDQAKMYSFTVPVFGKGVVYDCDYSKRTYQIGLLRDRLVDESLASYCAPLREETLDYFDKEFKTGEVLDARDSMLELISRTSVRALFGKEVRGLLHKGDGDLPPVSELLHTLEEGMLPLSVFWPSAPIPKHWRRDKARRDMSKVISPLLAKYRAQGAAESGFLEKLANSKYADGTPVPDEEVVGLTIAAFFGGMHNSSITTTWCLFEIYSRPELLAELREEQKAIVKGDTTVYDYEGYKRMKKLRAVVSEVLRLHPPLMLLMRTAEEDLTFKGYTIPKGSVLTVNPPVACRLEEAFPKPDEFQKDRFQNGSPPGYKYIAFGEGRRICKGKEFGYLQIMAVVSLCMRLYDFDLIDGVPPPALTEAMVIGPSKPSRVRVHRRQS
mmetsp:Transcript_16330/g.37674  ORF Transcript_16330/g.37674 Transcript_16330/m.37674 type:complete len:481 (+) Transcript_16330:62-1504(+)